jgi:tRNA-splicing ligase RtcB
MTRIRGDDLIAIGLEQGPVFGVALGALPKAVKRLGREQALAELQLVVAAPEEHLKAARERFTWKQVQPLLDRAGVKLLSAGIDENPLVYKDINAVIAAQSDLVDVVARFTPRIVRMADAGEQPED